MNNKNEKFSKIGANVQNFGQVEYPCSAAVYFIGLDIGTDSIGWAATDVEYNLLRSGGKPMWGAYLFDEAQTAEERRLHRTSRRRYARVRERIALLQALFDEEIAKVDKTFFLRLNDSKLMVDDKDTRIATKYILFGDSEYSDKQYFKQYPTIFHLRKALTERAPEDVRLLYLACHHIIKNRGHFLFDGQNMEFGGADIVREKLGKINACFLQGDDEGGIYEPIDEDGVLRVTEILKSAAARSDKQKALMEILGADRRDKRAVAVVKLMTGGTCNSNDLYGIEDKEENIKIDMSKLDDAKLVEISSKYDDCLIDEVKAIYDWSKLVNILGDDESISAARVRSYETHRGDLALLKKYVRTHCPQKYKDVFRHKDKLDNYAAYIGMDKHKSYKKATRDDFYKFLEKNVFIGGKDGFARFVEDESAKADASQNVRTAFLRYERGEFLPKQITSDNGVIPYQLHLKELREILDSAAKKFTFLGKAEDGITVADKIVSLLTFRIPYYVGPLGGGKFAWAVRKVGKAAEKVTPWNFDDIIDRDASEDKFIERMTAKCSYIPTEDVLPKNSLLYSEATMLNELNNLRIHGVKDERAIALVFEYAHAHKKITQSAILGVLKRNGYDMRDIDKTSLSGIDGDVKASLTSYIDLKRILGDMVDGDRPMCESIIKAVTLTSDRARLSARIKRNYGDKLSNRQITELCALGYSGWGRLSERLLTDVVSQKSIGSDGAPRNVIQTMREEYINLSETLTAERWGFAEAIDKCNGAIDGKPNIDELYCSPSVKRAIRRTVAIVSEIVKIRGCAPQKIMVEMARGGNESEKGERKSSRKQMLAALYKSISADLRDFSKEIEASDDRKFLSKRLYLYYLQNGKCMYTGEPIEIKDLNNKNVYDIDHIYPRSKLNDNSFDNLVLVKRQENARKKDEYPLQADIRNARAGLWRRLLDNGLLSKRKYERLMRSTPLSAQELADFENRQLVAMRQSTKEVAAILKRLYPDSEIVYSKAQKAAEFKDGFGNYAEKSGVAELADTKLVKVRELNNLHHAKDAYVNIVVGNVLNTEYGHDASLFYRNKSVEEMRSDYSLFINGVDGAWQPRRDLATVYNTYYNDNVRVVRFVSEYGGALFDATIKPAGANDKLIPLKASGKIADTSKYGGYDSASTAYFALVKSKDKKGNALLSLEAIPVLVEKNVAAGRDRVMQYIKNKSGLIDPCVVISKIRLNTLFSIDGSLAYIRGRQPNQVVWCNASEMYVDSSTAVYVKKVSSFVKKYSEAKKFKRELCVDEEYDGITRDANLSLYALFIEKLESKIYAGLSMAKQAANLHLYRNQFEAFDLETQCVVLMKILAFLNCNSVLLDLSDFVDADGKPLGKSFGKCQTSKSIENKHVKMITQSPTGHYRTVVDFDKFK